MSVRVQTLNCVLQCNHRFCPLLPFWTTALLFSLSPLFVRHTHALPPTLQPQHPWLLHFLTLWSPHWNNLPKDIRHFATLSSFKRQTEDISLLQIVQLSNAVFHLYQSVQCVCMCVCVCLCLCACVCVCSCVCACICLHVCVCVYTSCTYSVMLEALLM